MFIVDQIRFSSKLIRHNWGNPHLKGFNAKIEYKNVCFISSFMNRERQITILKLET